MARKIYQHLFIKEMAYYVTGRYHEYIIEGDFARFKHTFLIRNPEAVGLSWYRSVMSCHDDRFTCPDTLGFEAMYCLYEAVKSKDPAPLATEDLFSHPR